MNKIRNITHHVEKGPLSKDQVDYVRRVHRLVKIHVGGQEPIEAGSVFLPNVGEADGGERSEAAE